MRTTLLTDVLISLVNRRTASHDYGVAIINLPDFDYCSFVKGIKHSQTLELFLLGFSSEVEDSLRGELPALEGVRYAYSVEEAEASRNTGDETVFRILIIKRLELEKLSSLRWFPEITLESVYKESCSYAADRLDQSNVIIDTLLKALRRKTVRAILNFERVLEYLEVLLDTPADSLPEVVVSSYYKLGLCADQHIAAGRPSV